MKRTLHLFIGLILCTSVFSQTYTLNWGSSFSGGWTNGATTGTANNIGGSGISCTVTVAKSGGVFASSSGISAPTVTYSQVTVPGSTNNLMVALDYSNPSQYTDITFTFTGVAYNLSFYLSDIDRLTNTSNSYFDDITLSGKIGTTTVLPTLTKYDAVTDPSFLIISGNTVKVNNANGMAGNTASDATDQKGTVKVDFYGKTVTSVTIRYANSAGVAADPSIQYIGIGNIKFQNNFPLSVQLTSFDGANGNGKNTLNWKTVKESEMAYYAIERSEDGKDFREVGRVASRNSALAEAYEFSDNKIAGSQYYYRLRMVNNDGSSVYSKTLALHSSEAAVKLFPTVFTSSISMRLSSQVDEILRLKLVNLSGEAVYQNDYKIQRGSNEIAIALPSGLQRGQYFAVVETRNSSQSVSIIKQ